MIAIRRGFFGFCIFQMSVSSLCFNKHTDLWKTRDTPHGRMKIVGGAEG